MFAANGFELYKCTYISTAAELLGKQLRKRKPWVTPEILDLCDQRRDLKKKRGEPEGAEDYREIKRKIRTEMKMAKETWIQGQGQEVEACLRKNNSKKVYQLVKDLTTEKQGKSTTTQDKSGKWLTEENEILNRWTEYCSDLYNYETEGDPIVLDCPQIPDEEHHPILREEVEAAVKAMKMGNSAGVDNIPVELVQAGGEAMTDILTRNLQQDLEDRRMADHMDSIPSYHTPKERQLTAVPELQNHQPYQPS